MILCDILNIGCLKIRYDICDVCMHVYGLDDQLIIAKFVGSIPTIFMPNGSVQKVYWIGSVLTEFHHPYLKYGISYHNI